MGDVSAVRLLIFRVGDLTCATEAEAVREIIPRLEATRIPGAPAAVAGVVNVRGTLVTVVDGWRALGQRAPEGKAGTIVLLELQADASRRGGAGGAGAAAVPGDAGRPRLIGFAVDEVLDLLTLSEEALERRQALPGVDPTLVRAVGRRAGQLFVVLNTDELLAPIL